MKNIKPSELIKLAINDLEQVEKMPNIYTVDMNVWHSKFQSEKCFVCLAGAFIAISLHGDPLKQIDPMQFPGEIQNMLFALNCFRQGSIISGLNWMQITLPKDICSYFPVKAYNCSGENFKKDMLSMANYLETFKL